MTNSASSATDLIQLHHIESYYGDFHALKHINLQIKKGEVVVLLGASGAGKSSLLKVFNLLSMPSKGTMILNELNHALTFDFSKSIKEEDIKMLRRHVGIVFQNYNLWPHFTVMQNLIEAPVHVLKESKASAKARAQELLNRLKIGEFAARFPLHLSGGQQQRVAIARALMMNPDILLFDEPTAALDPEITVQVAEIIRELAQTQMTQIIVTHDIAFAKKIATQVIFLEHGQIIESGSKAIFDAPQTEAFKHYLSHSL